eukprot:m.28415 g.28415  ORF g.28415 m.28415 type:complete len:352 (+) comp9467_c0_seq1:69-1124(+)
MSYGYREGDDETAPSSSFQVDAYDGEGDDGPSAFEDHRPRLLLMGLRSSGKTSISKVVFHKMSPNETMFLETTRALDQEPVSNNSFLNLQIWDCPAQVDFFDEIFDRREIFGLPGALVFVIDAQDDHTKAVESLLHTIQDAHQINKKLNIEILVHKVDGLTADEKRLITQQLHEKVYDGLYSQGEPPTFNFYLTSIFDASIFEALSKITQKLVPQFDDMKEMLDSLSGSCNMSKSYLFDVSTKIYVAADGQNVDMNLYEACSDSIDLVTDVSGVYSEHEDRFAVAFDDDTEGVVPLNDSVLYLRHVNQHLILVAVVPKATFDEKPSIVRSNVKAFKRGLNELLPSLPIATA